MCAQDDRGVTSAGVSSISQCIQEPRREGRLSGLPSTPTEPSRCRAALAGTHLSLRTVSGGGGEVRRTFLGPESQPISVSRCSPSEPPRHLAPSLSPRRAARAETFAARPSWRASAGGAPSAPPLAPHGERERTSRSPGAVWSGAGAGACIDPLIVRGLRLTSLLRGKPSPWRPGPLPQRRIVNSCRQRPGSLGRGPRAPARRGSGRHAEAPFERRRRRRKKKGHEKGGGGGGGRRGEAGGAVGRGGGRKLKGARRGGERGGGGGERRRKTDGARETRKQGRKKEAERACLGAPSPLPFLRSQLGLCGALALGLQLPAGEAGRRVR